MLFRSIFSSESFPYFLRVLFSDPFLLSTSSFLPNPNFPPMSSFLPDPSLTSTTSFFQPLSFFPFPSVFSSCPLHTITNPLIPIRPFFNKSYCSFAVFLLLYQVACSVRCPIYNKNLFFCPAGFIIYPAHLHGHRLILFAMNKQYWYTIPFHAVYCTALLKMEPCLDAAYVISDI